MKKLVFNVPNRLKSSTLVDKGIFKSTFVLGLPRGENAFLFRKSVPYIRGSNQELKRQVATQSNEVSAAGTN